ncbi:NAD+ synthase [Rhodanobacter thiooxydans]|uniref:Glutamine-dependent NAD(+) synthetase n=1 Tax=Rhodanobacter thiooxydans TaxID=416169 RepID=A0A154QJ68_9GAMM|nr:NAD+ synthase [Rhodanobacter thiooxydans]EIL96533.1 NAD synthetase [Rhodanobacter thiooxydans LCS2]KZC24346.1 NAD+ synthase [Rhodanobacter thiooxydans]MCW0202685.1 NAD+ synthase [Rhodanobacter thiooxydans]
MARLRLALAQYDFPVGAVAANAAKAGDLIARARRGGAALVAFPELTLSGYPPEDLLLRPSFLAACDSELAALAAATNGVAALVGHPHSEGEVFNAASLLRGGLVDCTAHKQVLPNYGVFDDKRYFRPGHESTTAVIDGVRVGFLVCEDVWQPEPAAQAAAAGAELLLVINASPWDGAKQAGREAVLQARARETGCAIAYLNMVGGQDEVVYDGGSLLVNGDGAIAARAPAFIDVLLWAEFDPASRTLSAEDWPVTADASLEATLYAALVRGTRDYIDKNGFGGVLLGLSGGIDSALTLALAVDALGAQRVTAVMMPTRYTSRLSLDGARAQAERLGVDYHVIDIEPTYQSFIAALTPAFAGKAADTTEENLQSRIRGTMLMALSNKHGRLLLATGNKSEMAVGYATLYGDMCGAYAPLKDVYKTVVYRLARWRNGAGNRESGIGNRESAPSRASGSSTIPDSRFPIPPEVIDRPPSAELRDNQTDQDSLPPYEVLDAILARFIEGEQSQAEIVAAGFVADVVHRVVRLVLVNEFKRRQAAPGPRVTTRAFGRERRYPITSGWR